MKTYRNNARVAGVLFITAAVAGVLSLPFSGLVNEADYLVRLNDNENRLLIGALLELIMAFACAGIAIWLYPVLRKQNEALALGSVGFRLLEAALFLVATVSLVSMLKLSQEYVNSGAADAASYQAIGALILTARDWAGYVTGAIAFGLGALMYYLIFYQSGLIPRWLAGWGLIAAVLHLMAAMLTMFGAEPFAPTTALLNVPIALNELVLAVWLIARGFDIPALPERAR